MAAINKNFVIKNGLEVDTNLIVADPQTNKVGIGTTVPQYTLHVNGGIGVTNVYVSGITTVINELRVGTGGTIFSVIAGPTGFGQSVGVGTANPAFLLDIRSPVSTGQTALYVQGDIRVTGDLNIDDISITNLNVSGISTFVGFATFRNNILVAGIGTITNLVSTSGTITNLTGTSGTITTFNSTTGNITNLTNTNLNVTGIATIATLNATGIGVTNFTVYNNLSVGGISTFTNGPVLIGSGTSTGTASQKLQVTGGTYVSGNLGIGSTNPTSALFVVGDARVTGVITATTFIGSLTGTASSTTNIPNLTGAITSVNTTTSLGSFSSSNLSTALVDKTGTGVAVFATSPTLVTPVLGSASASSINVSGISTLGTVRISSGIITATSGVVTYFGDGSYLTGTASNPTLQQVLNTGNTSTIGMSISGVSTLTTLNVGTGITANASGINVTGIISATSFSGNGANLTGISSVSFATTSFGLSGSPNITVGNVTGSAATFSNNLNVGTAITMYSSTGIISATKYYGDGSGLSGIDATRIVSGLSSVTVASSSTISANVNGSNIFNVTGTGVTMTSGKRLDVSSYSENVNFLGSVSGSTALDVGTYTVFVADISGTTSVTFTLSGAVSGRLSSATLILRFSGSGSRNVSLAINPKYVGGVGPTYSTTAVTDIISFFTADAGTTTFISVIGQGFA